MKNLMQNIFSMKKSKKHKILTLFGIKIKLESVECEIIDKLNQITDCLNKIERNNFSQNKQIELKCSKIANDLNPIKYVLGVLNQNSASNVKASVINIADQTEISINDKCPYCGSEKIYSIRDFNINNIIAEYCNLYNFNPISDVYKDKILEKKHCFNCDLEFYNYKFESKPLLYEMLLKSGKYTYPKYKWEYNIAIDFIKQHKIEKVLDVGCGEGYFLEKIAPIVDYALGCEFNEIAINRCKEKHLLVTNNDLKNIADKFDLVCLFQVLEHIENPKEFLLNALNLLNKNGFLMIATPNAEGTWCKSNNPSILNLPPHHCLDITKDFYYNFAKEYSLEVIDYLQDEIKWGTYEGYILPQNIKPFQAKYLSYILEKNDLKGHYHCIIYKKTN